MYPGGWKWNI